MRGVSDKKFIIRFTDRVTEEKLIYELMPAGESDVCEA